MLRGASLQGTRPMLWALAALVPGMVKGVDRHCLQAAGEEASLLQCRRKARAPLALAAARQAQREHLEQFLPKAGAAFKEPPVVTSPVTLRLTVAKLCGPQGADGAVKCWYTRAYATGQAPASVPGPTIRVRPGDTLKLTLINELAEPSPPCSETFNRLTAIISSNGYCELNTTNFHAHGVHTSPHRGSDDVFDAVLPGTEKEFLFDIPAYHMAGTSWYHAHRHHATAVQAGGGAHGLIVMDDPAGSLPPEIVAIQEKVVVLSLIDMKNFIHINGIFGQSTLEQFGLGNLWKDQNGRYLNQNTQFCLVNGAYKPTMTIKPHQWYRLRMVYAAVALALQIFPFYPTGGAHCEFQLLAKDGIYLNEAPRTVRKLYFASGNRADVAIRCYCLSVPCSIHLMSSGKAPPTDDPKGGILPELLKDFVEGVIRATDGPFAYVFENVVNQVLLTIEVQAEARPAAHEIRPPLQPLPPLRQFSVKRPCYLVDLRQVPVPKDNQARLEFMNPPDWRIRYAGQLYGGSAQGSPMRNDSTHPPLAVKLVGQVHQWYIRGPESRFVASNNYTGISLHAVHVHVNPFQLVSFTPTSPPDNFYQVGDWHDTFLHSTGQVMVKTTLDAFTGRVVLHCHLLDHEDMGMMGYFEVQGAEGAWWRGARAVDPTCYREASGVGWSYLTGGPISNRSNPRPEAGPRWVKAAPGDNCHGACADLGGCSGRWPSSAKAFHSVLRSLGEVCNMTTEGKAEAPSIEAGVCSISCTEPILERQRCGIDPPESMSRFCPCLGF